MLHVHSHPLIDHKLALLRDRDTPSLLFRSICEQIAALMCFSATQDLPTKEIEIDTPLERTVGRTLAAPITVVPILRAGLAMSNGVAHMIPTVRIGMLGMARDEETLEPVTYVERLPQDIGDGPVLVVDPMLATGGSALAALQVLRERGARDMRLMVLVASPEGVARIEGWDPDLPIHCAALDRQLNDVGYILPGLGDAGDRAFGTPQ
jgi:uracil phosphoribosyltransferase